MHIDVICLQDIELPEDLKRMLSQQASAKREKRATMTKADGDRLAAESLAQAAIMERSPIALKLRTPSEYRRAGGESLQYGNPVSGGVVPGSVYPASPAGPNRLKSSPESSPTVGDRVSP